MSTIIKPNSQKQMEKEIKPQGYVGSGGVPFKSERFAYNLNDVSQGTAKPAGIPIGITIFILLVVVALGGYYAYTKLYMKPLPPPAPIKEAVIPPAIIVHYGDVLFAKTKDSIDVSLYAETNIILDDYNTTLMALSTIASGSLTIPNQELTYNVKGGKMLVYKCEFYRTGKGKTAKISVIGKIKKL